MGFWMACIAHPPLDCEAADLRTRSAFKSKSRGSWGAALLRSRSPDIVLLVFIRARLRARLGAMHFIAEDFTHAHSRSYFFYKELLTFSHKKSCHSVTNRSIS